MKSTSGPGLAFVCWASVLYAAGAFGAEVRAAQNGPPPPSGMVLIAAGSFQMGNCLDPDEGLGFELPVHTVYLSAFYLDRCLVTKALWDEVHAWATTHGYRFGHRGSGKGPDHPVHSVNWYDAVKWCNARSEKEGWVPAYYTSAAQTNVYRTGQLDLQNDWVKWNAGYRLPTEAEWEKAARGALSGKRFPWGDTIDHSRANYWVYRPNGRQYYPYDLGASAGAHPAFKKGSSPHTSPVGYFAPNGFGLYDMAGNIWQWCWDRYAWYPREWVSDPRGDAEYANSVWRIYRGGSWSIHARHCRSAHRGIGLPANRESYGLRTALGSVQRAERD